MIASRVKEIIDTTGLSMKAFGKKLGCTRDMVANIVYRRVQPKEVFLDHLCEVFGVNPQWLYNGESPMFNEEAGRGAIIKTIADEQQVDEATELFRSLSPDLRELALSQMKSLQKLMKKKKNVQAVGAKENLDTIRLMAAMFDTQAFSEVAAKAGKPIPIGKRIHELLEEESLSVERLADASQRSVDEIKEILASGKGISRDFLIAISLALSLEAEETQRLLTAAGFQALYPKNRRDAACLFALINGLGVVQLNEMLTGLEEAVL